MVATKKNGKIECYRFVFCIAVLLFHMQKYFLGEASLSDGIHLALFPHGSMGVEFFFLLSGFLMAKSVHNSRIQHPEMANNFSANDGIKFLKKKYMSIFPQHVVAFIFSFIAYILLHELGLKSSILTAIKSIPNFFLVQMSGISLTNPNHLEWYLSCMLIATAILYPFLKRYYDVFSQYAAPLIALLILGYIYHDSKSLTGVTKWTGFAYKGMLRAVAEILLGIWSFALCAYIRRCQNTKKRRMLCTLVEMLCFIGICGYMLLTMSKEYEIFALMACLILIAIAFSGVSYTDKFFQNRFCLALGKLSLPIYLSQLTAIYLVQAYFMDLAAVPVVLLGVAITLVVALVVMILGDRLAKYIK